MDTLLLMSTKDAEILQLREELNLANEQVDKFKARAMAAEERARTSSQAVAAPPPPPTPTPPPPVPFNGGSVGLEEAIERAEKAEADAMEQKQALVKVTAKLNAVSTLYTEAAQREAVLRLELEQAALAKPPSYD